MKILYDYQALTMQKYGGVSQYMYQLINGIQNHADITLPVLFPISSYFEPMFHDELVSDYLPKTRKIIRGINNINTVTNIIGKEFDIYHPGWYNMPLLLKKRNIGRVVVTIHDMIHELFPEYFADAKREIANKRKYINHADGVIAVSENTKNDILRLYPHIPSDKVRVIYPGGLTDIKKNSIKAYPDLPERFILFVGARNGYKNFFNFLKAFIQVLLIDENVNLVCVGGGEFKESEMKELQKVGVSEKVHQISCEDGQLNYIYKKAEFFVYPSMYEGFGVPIVEAFENGCLVLASDIPVFREVAGDSAIFFSPCDINDMTNKMKIALLSDFKAELIRKGYQRAKRYTWKGMVDEIYKVYQEVLELRSDE